MISAAMLQRRDEILRRRRDGRVQAGDRSASTAASPAAAASASTTAAAPADVHARVQLAQFVLNLLRGCASSFRRA